MPCWCLGRVDNLVQNQGARSSDCGFHVGVYDFGADCGTPVGSGTSVSLLSSDRIRENSLDHTGLLDTCPSFGRHRTGIFPPVHIGLLIGIVLLLFVDPQEALSVVPVPLGN